MKTIEFLNFGRPANGRVITHCGDYVVALSRNPYGSHNMVLVDEGRNEAICHGDAAVLQFAYNCLGRRAYRRAARVAAARGLRWCFEGGVRCG